MENDLEHVMTHERRPLGRTICEQVTMTLNENQIKSLTSEAPDVVCDTGSDAADAPSATVDSRGINERALQIWRRRQPCQAIGEVEEAASDPVCFMGHPAQAGDKQLYRASCTIESFLQNCAARDVSVL